MFRVGVIILTLINAAGGAPAIAAESRPGGNADADDAPIVYIVRRGDTLIALARKYLISIPAYQIVQRENHVSNPVLLPTGKKLLIRRSLLKHTPAEARILSVRGNVNVTDGGREMRAKSGQILSEGSRLSTSDSSFVTLALSNGSQVSLPSNSDVRIRLLRRYQLGGSLDYDFDVLQGGTRSKVNPLKSGDDRYRVRTPKAVSAVRGTDFQSRYDPAADRDFAEVIEGQLGVGGASGPVADLPAGEGLALTSDGKAIREALLREPQLIDPGKLQVNSDVTFAAAPSAEEKGYRFLLATDAGFVDQIADLVTSDNSARFQNIENGVYFIRARAVSANGIQGKPVTFAFKRRLNAVKGSIDSQAGGYGFKWLGAGEGVRHFHFQLFRGAPNGIAMVDETAANIAEISITDLPPGDYFWRVGAVQFLDNEVTTNWTDFEKLVVAP